MRRKKSRSPNKRGKKDEQFSEENLYNMGVKLSSMKYGGNVAQTL